MTSLGSGAVGSLFKRLTPRDWTEDRAASLRERRRSEPHLKSGAGLSPESF